jgi:hypothetical protein
LLSCSELGASLVGQVDAIGGIQGGGEEESTSGISTSDSLHRLSAIVQRLDSLDNRDLHLQIHDVEDDNRRFAGQLQLHWCKTVLLTKLNKIK